MGKKRSWFGFLKRFLICKAQSTKVKDHKNDMQKTKKQRLWCFGMLTTTRHYHTLNSPAANVAEEKKHHTLALAVAMTVAAEAAVAAANAAAELARLVGRVPHRRTTHNEAAIKIQSFYRSHLAWKALIGLKGVVKLQSVIRGEIVRRKLLSRLKITQQSKLVLHQIRIPTFDQIRKEKNDLFTPRMSNQIRETQRRLLRFGDNHHTEPEHNSPSFRSRMSCNVKKHRCYLSQDHRTEDTSLPNSPVFPAYMAATESFMAKARSLSTPRQRISFIDHAGYCTHASSSSSCGMPCMLSSSSSSFDGGIKGKLQAHAFMN